MQWYTEFKILEWLPLGWLPSSLAVFRIFKTVEHWLYTRYSDGYYQKYLKIKLAKEKTWFSFSVPLFCQCFFPNFMYSIFISGKYSVFMIFHWLASKTNENINKKHTQTNPSRVICFGRCTYMSLLIFVFDYESKLNFVFKYRIFPISY